MEKKNQLEEKIIFLKIVFITTITYVIAIIFIVGVKEIFNLEVHSLLNLFFSSIISAYVTWKISPLVTGYEPGCKWLRVVTIFMIAVSIGCLSRFVFLYFLEDILKKTLLKDQIFEFGVVISMITAGLSFLFMIVKLGTPSTKPC